MWEVGSINYSTYIWTSSSDDSSCLMNSPSDKLPLNLSSFSLDFLFLSLDLLLLPLDLLLLCPLDLLLLSRERCLLLSRDGLLRTSLLGGLRLKLETMFQLLWTEFTENFYSNPRLESKGENTGN